MEILFPKRKNILRSKTMRLDIFSDEVRLKKGIIVLLVAGLVLTMSFIGYLLSGSSDEIIVTKSTQEGQKEMGIESKGEEDTANIEDGSKDAKSDKINASSIKVYVVGEVKKPGLITINKGQILKEAVDLAGGTTEAADVENINMAYEIFENMTIKILPKNMNDVKVTENVKEETSKTVGMTIIKDVGNAQIIKNTDIESQNTNSSQKSNKVNINTASSQHLDSLPGIGPSTADKIISYRDKNGRFNSIQDILNVSGIGESKFESIKDLITVE